MSRSLESGSVGSSKQTSFAPGTNEVDTQRSQRQTMRASYSQRRTLAKQVSQPAISMAGRKSVHGGDFPRRAKSGHAGSFGSGSMDEHQRHLSIDSEESLQANAAVKLGDVFGGKKLCGDVFGSSRDAESTDSSLMYKSRTGFGSPLDGGVASNGPTNKSKKKKGGDSAFEIDRQQAALNGGEGSASPGDKIFGFDDQSEEEDDDEAISALTQRQRLALTLKNWCMDEKNVDIVLRENGVSPLLQMSKAPAEDVKVRRYTAQAFFHLSEKSRFRKQLIDEGSTGALLRLASSLASANAQTNNRLLKEHLGSGNFPRNIAAAICNLTLCEGGEAKMVNDGAVIALRMILGHQVANNPRSNISSICVQALFNLTCVTEIYAGLETVIKALIALVPTGTIDPRSVTATACCNCSNFFKLRVRMLEAGAVQVLTNVGSSKPRSLEDGSGGGGGGGDKSERGVLPIVSVEGIEASKDLAYHAAVCFHNMATARSCRADMVIRGAASVMVSLSDNTTSLELLHCVAATLQKLALDVSSRKRIIKDGAVRAIYNVISAPGAKDNKKTAYQCAMTLYNLSAFEDCVLDIVRDGAIETLVDLCAVPDYQTRSSCATAFCNILSNEQVHDIILRSRALPTLFSVAEQVSEASIVEPLSFAFHNLSCGGSTRKAAVAAGIVAPLVGFSHFREPSILRCCSAALCNLAAVNDNIEKMVSDGVLGALSRMLLSGTPEVTSLCSGALATIAYDHASHEELVKQGLLCSVVKACIDKNCDANTRQACCSVLASLSFFPQSRIPMRDLGVIPGFMTPEFMQIARADEAGTGRRCATVLCNLACETVLRKEMVDSGVVSVMDDLSNTYSENTLQDCAKCFCNLSCDPETPVPMVEQGAVLTLMMICMVRSVSDTTKLMCAKALLNLVTPSTLTMILGTGIVHALASLSSIECEETMDICAELFCVVSCNEEGRGVIAERQSTLQGLFSLMRSKSKETQVTCGKAVCNLLRYPESQMATAKSGALLVIKVLATLGSEETEVTCAEALAMLSLDDKSRSIVINERACSVLVMLTQSAQPATVLAAVRAMSCLSYHKRLRAPLIEAGTVSSLLCIVLNGRYMDEIMEDCARTLCYLSISHSNREQMIEEKVVCALVVLCKRSTLSVVDGFIGLALQRLCWFRSRHRQMMEDGGVAMLVMLMKKALVHLETDEEMFRIIICDCMSALANLSCTPSMLEGLLETEIIETLVLVANKLKLDLDQHNESIWRMANTLFHFSEPTRFRSEMVLRGAVEPLVELLPHGNDASKQCCGAALCNLSKAKDVQKAMVDQGAVDVLVKLAETDNTLTKQWCGIALANLSMFAKLENGTVKALLTLSVEDMEEKKEKPVVVQASEETMDHAKHGKKMMKAMVKTGMFHTGNQALATIIHRSSTLVNDGPDPGSPEDMKARRTTQRLVGAAPEAGQLLGMPPEINSRLGGEDDHRRYSMTVIAKMTRMHQVEGTKTEAGVACPEMRPPAEKTMAKIRSISSNGDEKGGNGTGEEKSESVATNAPASFHRDDIILLRFPKVRAVPDLRPQSAKVTDVPEGGLPAIGRQPASDTEESKAASEAADVGEGEESERKTSLPGLFLQ